MRSRAKAEFPVDCLELSFDYLQFTCKSGDFNASIMYM